MSTLDGSIWSRCSIALTCPARSHYSAHRAGKDGARVGMNVTAYQEKNISGNRKKLSKLTAEHFNRLESLIFMNRTVVSNKVGQASPRLLESGMQIQALLSSPRLADWSEFERNKDFYKPAKATH